MDFNSRPAGRAFVRVFVFLFIAASAPAGAQVTEEQPPVDLGTTVVTGTHIRGARSAGSQLIVIDRDAIEASGLGRVQDLLEVLPQNFSGSTSEDVSLDIGALNRIRGQAVDLRGLGASSTLVLVNGRRQPAGGVEGSFVDVASIAASAVERIEVLPDGASAIYGADAVGGVVNFVLRKDYGGAETRVRAASADAGEAEEIRFTQLLGKSFEDANVLVGYQYYNREPLSAGSGHYASAAGDMRPFGGSDFRPTSPVYYVSNPGNILSSTTLRPIAAIPPGQDGTDLDASDLLAGQTNFIGNLEGDTILPRQRMNSAFLSGSARLGERVELYADARYSERDMSFPQAGVGGLLQVPSTNPFHVNPSPGTSVFVGYFLGPDLGPLISEGRSVTHSATLGSEARLWSDWSANLAYTHGRESNEWRWLNNFNSARLNAALADTNPATAFNPFGDGSNTNPATIDAIRETVTGEGTSTVLNATLILDGTVFTLPGGPAKLAAGLDYREERLDAEAGAIAPATGVYTRSTRSIGEMKREVSSAFAELALPVLGNEARTGRLDLSLAGRLEDYSDFGRTTNPKAGLTWTPFEAISLRGTWGTSFRTPRFNQTNLAVTPLRISRVVMQDPESPTGTSSAFVIIGNNPDLQEETSTMWTAGLDILPPSLPTLEISATYFDLDYRDKIALGGPANIQNTLVEQAQWAEFIVRNPTAEQVNALCAQPEFVGSCAPAPAVIVDRRLQNLAVLRVNGIDLEAAYTWSIGRTKVAAGLQGTHMLGYRRAVSDSAPEFDVANTVGTPLDLRLRGRLSVAFGGWSAGAFINYQGSADDPVNDRRVDDWTTFDLNVSYEFEGFGSWLDGTRLQLNAINALDEPPPFVNVRTGFDAANASELGRVLSAELVRSW